MVVLDGASLTIESLVAGLFLVVVVVGFKKNLWLVVAAIAGHGVFDFFHRLFIENPGVPVWWPGFCMSFDVLAGGFLALLLARRSGFERVLGVPSTTSDRMVSGGPTSAPLKAHEALKETRRT